MADFIYKGRDSKGVLVEGLLSAPSKQFIAAELLKKGITPIAIDPHVAQIDINELFQRIPMFKPTVSLDELVLLCRQMFALTRAGIP